MNIFNENRRKIAEHNDIYEKGLVTFKMGLNEFADWTYDEFVRITGKIDETTHADGR